MSGTMGQVLMAELTVPFQSRIGRAKGWKR